MSGIWGEGDPVILLNMLSGKIVLLRQIMGGKEGRMNSICKDMRLNSEDGRPVKEKQEPRHKMRGDARGVQHATWICLNMAEY